MINNVRKAIKFRDYQHLAVAHILDVPRCALWAGMGLGKTCSTLTALDIMFLAGEDSPALVLAPLRVARKTWSDEAAKWEHLRHVEVSAITGSVEERRAAMRRRVSVYTCNYENLPWLLAELKGEWPFGTVVCDESTRLKGFRLRQGTARARALAPIAHTKVKRWINLTGTPSPNGLNDLWGQSWFLDAGVRLGRTYDSFRQRWFQKSFDGYGVTPLPFAQEQIEGKLRDICLSIDAADYFDLEKPIINNIYVDLPIRVRKLYRDMEKELFMHFDGQDFEAFNAAARTQKLLQLANGAVYCDDTNAKQWKEIHDEKIQALLGIVEEAMGAPILVAYQFRSDLARLSAAFPSGRLLSTASDEDDWNAGKIPILFAHPKSAGHGIELQHGGNIIVFFGHDWNLEEYQQIIERLGPVRQMQSGYNRPVFIHHIIARDTIDELVMARRESKRSVQDLLLEAMKKRKP
jgi:SNF2 family DNA or RNA helicase